MSGNNESSNLVQKKVEGTTFEKAVDMLLVAAKHQRSNREQKVHNNNKPANNYGNEEVVEKSTVVAMKILGKGQTSIKMSVYNKINWKSYTKATRQLLVELFPRTVLATHSLSGKKSPAFQNKPAKHCLDANIISDIIETVCRKSNVKENLVRHVITIKCADEAKMLRQREKKSEKKADNNSRLTVHNDITHEEDDSKQKKLSIQENFCKRLRSVYLSVVGEKHNL